jgi:hypothetical protein
LNDIATHLRITGLQYENAEVDARRSGANALKAAWSKITSVPLIILKAQDVATSLTTGVPSTELGGEVQTAVQKKASAFLHEDRPLEVGVVAGVAAQDLITGLAPDLSGWMTADVWAMALWSALSFQPPLTDPKREALRIQILEAARKRAIEGAEVARQRVDVPDIPGPDDELPAPKLQALAKTAVAGLRRNSALDREELDFLWWTLADRSRVLNRRFSTLNESTRLIAAAIDASGLLRRLPCSVHRELVLKNLDADPEMNLSELLVDLGDARSELAAAFQDLAPKSPLVFPVLSAMITAAAGDGAGAGVKRNASEWAQRVLLEATMCRITQTGPKKR